MSKIAALRKFLVAINMNQEDWKKRADEALKTVPAEKGKEDGYSLYSSLAAAIIWPLVESFQGADAEAMDTFSSAIQRLNAITLATRFGFWTAQASSGSDLRDAIGEDLASYPSLQTELDALFDEFNAIEGVLDRPKDDQEKLAELLYNEWEASGRGSVVQKVSQRIGIMLGGTVSGVTVQLDASIYQERAEEARRRYLKDLRRQCRYLPLSAVGAEAEEANVSLSDVYVGLKTYEGQKLASGKRAGLANMLNEEGAEREEIEAIEAIKKHDRVVLLGDPGSGKSTFVNEILAQYADVQLGESEVLPAEMPADLVPVRIILRDLAVRLRAGYPEGIPKREQDAVLNKFVRDAIVEDLKLADAEAFGEAMRTAFSTNLLLLICDGLDEVPYRQRKDMMRLVRTVVGNAKKLIVTCRIRSYDDEGQSIPGCGVYTLAPFDADQKKTFATAWYGTEYAKKKFRRDRLEKVEDLAAAAVSDELDELAENPMLLTTMALIHQRGHGLPDQRFKLFSEAIEILLWKWQEEKGGEYNVSEQLAHVLGNKRRIRESLMRLAYASHSEPSEGQEFADISRLQALEILTKAEYLGSWPMANEFLDYVDQKAGLFQGRGGSGTDEHPLSYGFPHRQFQEYLAGCYIAGQDLDVILEDKAKEGDFWYEAIKLGLESKLDGATSTRDVLKNAYLMLPPRFPTAIYRQRLLLWTGLIASLVGADVISADQSPGGGGKPFLKKLKGYLVRLLDGSLPPIERAEAGLILGQLGDPREEVTSVEKMPLCFVLSGPFIMGWSEDEFADELRRNSSWKRIIEWATPKREETLGHSFWIGKYPITQGQYARFIAENGYENAEYWSDAGWEMKQEQGWTGPQSYREAFQLANHPVVGVSWYEAYAYTQWLMTHLGDRRMLPDGWIVSLPTEAEWEKAARGGLEIPEKPVFSVLSKGLFLERPVMKPHPNSGQVYSWGDEPDENKMNYYQTGIRRTSAPGCFTQGASKYGVQDVLGNVWEWTGDLWSEKYVSDVEKRQSMEDIEGSSPRVLRGGAFYLQRLLLPLRVPRRLYDPNYRFNYVGFRIVLRPPP